MPQALKILLVRHGQTDWNVSRRVMGKQPIGLNAVGRAQAAAVRDMLAGVRLDAVYHSPHLRAEETACMIAEPHVGVLLAAEASLGEIDYGEWEGKYFRDLLDHEAFRHYFENPEKCTIPGGEHLPNVTRRVVDFMESLRDSHAGKTVMLVSHADVIKAALLHYLHLPLASMHRLSIENASISYLHLSNKFDRVMNINQTPDMPALLNRGPLPGK